MKEWEQGALGGIRGQNSYTVTLDDDPIVCRMIQEILGIKTFSFSRVSELRENFEKLTPVGVFVDIHLADDECGLDVIPQIKAKWPFCPIIVITGDYAESLIGQALAIGADDFILKPVRPGELIARLITRRSEIELRNNQTILRFGDVTLDLRHKTLAGPNGQYFQSGREVEMLAYLIRSYGMVIDKSTLKRRVWGNISVSDNALDRKLFEVRKAIKSVSNNVEIRAVYGQGVVLRHKSFKDDQALLDDFETNLKVVKNGGHAEDAKASTRWEL